MPRRDSKGRFVKSRSRRSSKKRSRRPTRRRRSGMGSIIRVRRSGGLGEVNMGDLAAVLAGGAASLLTTVGVRYMVNPTQGSTQQAMVKWAPLLGLGAAGLTSLAIYALQMGTGVAVGSFSVGALTAASQMASDFVMKEKGVQVLAALGPRPTTTAPATATATPAGTSAILPEYASGMGALVMEETSGGYRPGSIGSYGEVVDLQGLNTAAFGTPGF